MILKFKTPVPIQKARELYNDSVKFITTTESYPNLTAIEFDSDPRYIFKRKYTNPKIDKLTDRLIESYKKIINKLWDNLFREINTDLENNPNIKIKYVIDKLESRLSEFVKTVGSKAKKIYAESYKLGKLKGQITSHQQLDHRLTTEDKKAIDLALKDNEKYLLNFSEDFKNKFLDKLKELSVKKLKNSDDIKKSFEDLIFSEVFPFAVPDLLSAIAVALTARILSYAWGAVKLVTKGYIDSLREAKMEEDELRITGGYWINHPTEGLGGEVCNGCEENSGNFFTLDEFEAEHGQNECLNRCRCTLEFRNE